MIKYSFVMPLFNSMAWMGVAINSVRKQTYQNWELIFVDDGSEDRTVDLAKKIVGLNPEKFFLLEQKNSGPAVARANALSIASGEYIVFLDSDDYVEDTYLQFINDVARCGADIIIPELMSQNRDGIFYSFNKKHNLNKGAVFDGKQAFRLTFPWKIHGFACYKTSLMRTHAVGKNSSFTNYNADEFITRLVFLNSEKIVVSDGKYFHTANHQSLTKKPSLRQLGFLETEKKLISLTEIYDLGFIDFVKTDSLKKLFNSYFGYLSNRKDFNEKDWNRIKKAHVDHYSYIKNISFKYKRTGELSLLKDTIYFLFKGSFFCVEFVKKIRFLLR